MTIDGVPLANGAEPPKLDLQKPLVIELPAAEAPAAGNQMKATLKLLGRSVFNADAAVEASPTGGAQMSFDFGGARFVAAGPTDLELRLADAPSNAEPIAQARIRTKQPLLTAPVIGAILLALYAIFTLEATNRTLTRRKKRAIGSIIGAGILGILLAASFAVLTWGLLGRVPGAPGVVVALVLGCIGGVGTEVPAVVMWLEHLLLLSMLQHESGRWTWGRYVVVHPEGNTDVAHGTDEYRGAGRRRHLRLGDDRGLARRKVLAPKTTAGSAAVVAAIDPLRSPRSIRLCRSIAVWVSASAPADASSVGKVSFPTEGQTPQRDWPNRYPTERTVWMRFACSSPSLARRRRMCTSTVRAPP